MAPKLLNPPSSGEHKECLVYRTESVDPRAENLHPRRGLIFFQSLLFLSSSLCLLGGVPPTHTQKIVTNVFENAVTLSSLQHHHLSKAGTVYFTFLLNELLIDRHGKNRRAQLFGFLKHQQACLLSPELCPVYMRRLP